MFDKTSLKSWQERGQKTLRVELYSAGCSGTKLSVREESAREWDSLLSVIEWIEVYTPSSQAKKLEGARITRVGAKWIVAHAGIQDRCGCGSSFSFDKKLISRDKLSALRNALGKKETVCEE